ncbi:hypothetical protein GCM10009557_02730 [Virgisporangium ochraceum]|uniref:Uncharacterized protein n=1 Tax=Virgisporangium ochraceum TaxID=65505 RepID=A0A8J4A1E1_9ACTN|nr:hypothetical protein Voc01_077190 [Virgisporangium ochraceum]
MDLGDIPVEEVPPKVVRHLRPYEFPDRFEPFGAVDVRPIADGPTWAGVTYRFVAVPGYPTVVAPPEFPTGPILAYGGASRRPTASEPDAAPARPGLATGHAGRAYGCRCRVSAPAEPGLMGGPRPGTDPGATLDGLPVIPSVGGLPLRAEGIGCLGPDRGSAAMR